jgi:glucose-1-phosphate thymidylyltransferase
MDVKGVIVVEDARAPSDAMHSRRLDAFEQVANRAIALHVLDALAAAGVEHIVVVSSREVADDVRKSLSGAHGVELAYVEQEAPVDLIGALDLAAPIVRSSPCIVHVANGLLGEPLAPMVDCLRADSPDVVVVMHQGSSPITRLSAATLAMLHVAELDPERDALGMAGVCLFGPDALRRASLAPWRAAGAAEDLDLTILAERITGAGGRFHVLPVNGWRLYAGDPPDLLELNRIALDRLDAQPAHPPNHGNRIEGRVWIDERATVRASVIVGPTVIGPGARIADAYIGPYTSVGADARIEGAEIERSIIAPGASIMHVGGRLVASVVGRNARIFRDFSVPRAMRLHVGEDTEVALC